MSSSSQPASTKKLRDRVRLQALKSALIGARGLQWGANRLRGVVQRTVSEEEAGQITTWWYSRARTYKGAPWQKIGLHEFESDVVAAHFPSAPAKLLVLGCGGGREVVALQALGYVCEASDPSEELCKTAEKSALSGTVVRVGGIADCAQHLPSAPFEAVVVGWGAWGYLLRPQTRLEALGTIRTLCPTGPVLLSWQMLQPKRLTSESVNKEDVPAKWRGGADHWRENLRVSPGRGIAALLSLQTVLEEAARCGYKMRFDGTNAGTYPHVVLHPDCA